MPWRERGGSCLALGAASTGATFKPVIGEDGRAAEASDAAYQQAPLT